MHIPVSAKTGTYVVKTNERPGNRRQPITLRDLSSAFDESVFEDGLLRMYQSMKSKQIYSSSRRRNLKGPEIQFYKTNCFLNHPFDSVVDKGNNSKKLSTGVDVVRL